MVRIADPKPAPDQLFAYTDRLSANRSSRTLLRSLAGPFAGGRPVLAFAGAYPDPMCPPRAECRQLRELGQVRPRFQTQCRNRVLLRC